VQRYLDEEIRFVCDRLGQSDVVLELGCGYGRVVWRLADVARLMIGIDVSHESLRLARSLTARDSRCRFVEMNAVRLAFPAGTFDAVVCVQDGICAFHVEQQALVREALRVVRSPGRVLFSSYSERFWPDRLEWFRLQAERGLVGAIDDEATRPGTIVCRDGFSVGTMTRESFEQLCAQLGVAARPTEVDGSSLFCEVMT
jgi:2-polyprenyl-6-hydroxyphenyl methylase/3-demethylubiquinone-9 3-methyltransferase